MEDFLKDVYTSIYKKWILFQQIDNCQIMLSSKDQNKIILETKYGVANVIFYKFNIIELNVISKIDQESCFFLHFQMNNINHAINLFYEMVECLKTLIKKPKIKSYYAAVVVLQQLILLIRLMKQFSYLLLIMKLQQLATTNYSKKVNNMM